MNDKFPILIALLVACSILAVTDCALQAGPASPSGYRLANESVPSSVAEYGQDAVRYNPERSHGLWR
jgi:hypothetical protein